MSEHLGWLAKIDKGCGRAFSPKRLPENVLRDLLEGGLVRTYGRGRSHGLSLTEKGKEALVSGKLPEA